MVYKEVSNKESPLCTKREYWIEIDANILKFKSDVVDVMLEIL